MILTPPHSSGHIQGALASWRYEFLVVGAVCAFWAICLLVFLPNSLATSRWFTRDDRMFLVARVAKNQTGIENRKIKWDHVTDFFTDIKSYMFFILGLVANIPNGGISNVSLLIPFHSGRRILIDMFTVLHTHHQRSRIRHTPHLAPRHPTGSPSRDLDWCRSYSQQPTSQQLAHNRLHALHGTNHLRLPRFPPRTTRRIRWTSHLLLPHWFLPSILCTRSISHHLQCRWSDQKAAHERYHLDGSLLW